MGDLRLAHSENRTHKALLIMICAAAWLLIYYLHSMVSYCSDDFYYSTFWDQGIKNFIQMSMYHFRVFNGRVLVHVLAQTVLALDIRFFAAFNTLLLFFTALLSYKICAPENKKLGLDAVLHAAVFAMLIMLINAGILKESLLWISGSYNYMFPVLLMLIAFYINNRFLANARNGCLFTLACVLMQVMSGATTEQCGGMAFAASLLLGVYMTATRQTGLARALIAPAANLMGYATIFLSPATRERLEGVGKIDLDLIQSNFTKLSGLFTGQDGCLAIMILFCLTASALYIDHRKPKALLLGIPVSVFLLCPYLMGFTDRICSLTFMVFSAYLVLVAILCVFYANCVNAGILLAAGLSSALIMTMANTFGPRITLPFILILCGVAAFFCTRIVRGIHPARRGRIAFMTALCVCFGVCVYVFSPTLKGYMRNYEIIKYNNTMIEEAHETGTLYYCIDLDTDYCHSTMYSSGYFYGEFLSCYALNDCKIYLVSSRMKAMYVNGERATSPAYLYLGKTHFPLRDIIEGLGGSVDWTPQQTVCSIGGRTATIIGDTLYYNDEAGNPASLRVRDKRAYGYYATCFTAEVFETAFGIAIAFDAGSDGYHVFSA